MPPRGRKPKPLQLKIIDGNPGKRPMNLDQPMPATAPQLPKPPTHLDSLAKRIWRQTAVELYRLGLLTRLDEGVLAIHCDARSTFLQAARRIRLRTATQKKAGDAEPNGAVIRTSNGNTIQHPDVGIKNQAAKLAMSSGAELGLSPSSRTRLVGPHAAGDDLDEFLDAAPRPQSRAASD